ncbi:MAG: acetyl-CoA carboxylase biotin carboxyl carrier protein [Chloroflexaceae bacterium]|nr:acetyl-CoA carboxylase biotin carboxyl carrier protein [Chloroflexaceae bacterium]
MSDEIVPSTSETDSFSIAEIRDLLQLVEGSDVSEITIERSGNKLHIKRGTPTMMMPAAHFAPMQATAPIYTPPPPAVVAPVHSEADTVIHHTAGAHHAQGQELTHHEMTHALKAPMVGTFYSAPSPKDPAFAKEGDEVYAGDVVCIIEAMKIMNEIESDVDGRVTRVLVKDGQPIEYGQPLLIIEPL